MREPFFGPNAKPLAIQIVVGVGVLMLFNWLVRPWFEPWVGQIICLYVTGSC